MVKKKEHGGPRPGSGAPTKENKKTTYSTKLRPHQIAFLRGLDNAGGWLEEMIDEKMAQITGGDVVQDIRDTAIPAEWDRSRKISWTCSCGVENTAETKGATAACKVCRARIHTGNTGIIISAGMIGAMAALRLAGAVYVQTSYGAGAWLSDMMKIEDGGLCPWAPDKPADPDKITPIERIFE